MSSHQRRCQEAGASQWQSRRVEASPPASNPAPAPAGAATKWTHWELHLYRPRYNATQQYGSMHMFTTPDTTWCLIAIQHMLFLPDMGLRCHSASQ